MRADRRAEQWLTRATLLGSGALVVGLGAAFVLLGSQNALAQAADSFLDVFTAAALSYAIAVGSQPEDAEHPLGHSRAEPLAALMTAMIAGVLAVEVGRSAIGALLSGQTARLEPLLLWVFGAKIFFKGGILLVARRLGRRRRSPAIEALAVDARNDVLLSSLAVVGYFGGRWGAPTLDAWLALPVALWIAAAGLRLGRENLRLLMGEAPTTARQQALVAIAASVPGVRRALPVRAHFLGATLDVHATVEVDGGLSVREAHDIGEAVRARLLAEEDVGHCAVHIDPA